MPQHEATCARKYWRKIQQRASLTDSVELAQSKSRIFSSRLTTLEVDDRRFREGIVSEARDEIDTLRIVHENIFDEGLAADALAQALLWFEETENIESYKAALAAALHLNISTSDLRRPHKPVDDFDQLFLLAIDVNRLARGYKQINDLDDATYTTILHVACATGFAELLEPLFWKGADFDSIDAFDNTPLELAIECGDIDTVRFALALGSDPNRNCPLSAAYDTGRHDIATLLVEHGAGFNQGSGETALLSSAICNNDLATFRLALSLGAVGDVTHLMVDLFERCLGHECYDCELEEMACLLIEQGADISVQDIYGCTIFHYACRRAHVKLLRTALDRISSPSILNGYDSDGETTLYYAVTSSSKASPRHCSEMVSMLLKAGADVNLQNAHGESALMLAAREGNEELVRLLLDAGAIDNDTYVSEQSALLEAAYGRHVAVVRHLLERMSRFREDSAFLTHALEFAVGKNHGDTAKDLLSYGADPSNAYVLIQALQSSSFEVVQILLEAGARFDRVAPDLLEDLFAARDEDTQGHDAGFIEASAKCELLVRAFPNVQMLYLGHCLPRYGEE